MSQVYKQVEQSKVATQAGLEAGQQAVLGELKPPAPEAPAVVAPAVQPVAQPAAPGKPKPKVIIGGQQFSDDF